MDFVAVFLTIESTSSMNKMIILSSLTQICNLGVKEGKYVAKKCTGRITHILVHASILAQYEDIFHNG